MTQSHKTQCTSQKLHKSGPMTRLSLSYRGYHSNPTRIPYWIISDPYWIISDPYRIISDPYRISITTPHPLHPDLDPIGSSVILIGSPSQLHIPSALISILSDHQIEA